jgi:membrane-bound metal-dependent hydrolase YbcI (DUF457 family)
MLGHSHALSGGVVGLAAGIFLHLPIPQTAALAGCTASMALLPDLDKCGSSPARSLGFVSEAVAWVFGRISGGHRHATHSFHLLPEPLAFTTGTLPELLIIDPILSGALLALAAWIIDPGWLRAQWGPLAGLPG